MERWTVRGRAVDLKGKLSGPCRSEQRLSQ
jgi:hypothetical protein